MSELEAEERSELLALARRTIETFLLSRLRLQYRPASRTLENPAAAFVSLYNGPALRGCVGQRKNDRPLFRNVMEAALAAIGDPRFPPLDSHELGGVTIEISVLTPFVEVSDPAEIEVGRDGLLISKGSRSGLLLPQVGERFGWDAIRFLEETCVKAGLKRDCWCEGARIQKFSAQIMSEAHQSEAVEL
jgi:AmmeMemoRadiSam system protein A